eukprot:5033419-Pleurochrysis_carterae.AAC.1
MNGKLAKVQRADRRACPESVSEDEMCREIGSSRVAGSHTYLLARQPLTQSTCLSADARRF